MRNSLLMRAARASVAGTLFLSVGLAPALAHMAGFPHAGPSGRPGMGYGRGHAFAAPGLNRNGMRRGPNRGVVDGRGRFVRNGPHGRGSRFNQALTYSCCGWGGWSGWSGPGSTPTAPDAPVVVGGGPAFVFNLPSSANVGDGGYGGGCVIHKLQFDSAGKYIGERQYSEC